MSKPREQNQINLSTQRWSEIFYLLSAQVLAVSFVAKAKKPTAEEEKKKKEYYAKKEKKAAEVKKKK
jgi:hypothetical protein